MKCTHHKAFLVGFTDSPTPGFEPTPVKKLFRCSRKVGHGGAHNTRFHGKFHEWSSAEGKFIPPQKIPKRATRVLFSMFMEYDAPTKLEYGVLFFEREDGQRLIISVREDKKANYEIESYNPYKVLEEDKILEEGSITLFELAQKLDEWVNKGVVKPGWFVQKTRRL